MGIEREQRKEERTEQIRTFKILNAKLQYELKIRYATNWVELNEIYFQISNIQNSSTKEWTNIPIM